MPRSAPPIYQVHIADGFSSDCDELVHQCLQLKNLDFQEFCILWKKMNFDLIYQGRSSGAEIAELSEELIYIAKHYMVKDTSYFAESVTGLFLVYSLLNLQPFAGFAFLRIIPEDVRAINRIEMVARRERKLDVLYILGEVLTKWTQYHADERPRGMESVMRKYLEGYTSIDKLGVRPMGVFYRQNEELDHIRDLGSITRQYTLAKKSLFAGKGSSEPSLQYINENLSHELNASLRKLISGIIDESEDEALDNDDDESSEDECTIARDRSKTVQDLKFKAMSNAVDAMKHLTSTKDRKTSKLNPTSKSDLKKPTGKIKTGSHIKPVTTSPKKRKTDEGSPKKKSMAAFRGHEVNINDDTILNIDEFHKVSDNVLSIDLTSDDDDHESAEEEIKYKHPQRHGIEIEVEPLPLMFRTSDWANELEIEIIDHTKAVKPDEVPSEPNIQSGESNDRHESSRKSMSLKMDKKGVKTYRKKRKNSSTVEDEKEFAIRKRDRREQKRREIKSRFKKMGMLPIANFKDQNKDK